MCACFLRDSLQPMTLCHRVICAYTVLLILLLAYQLFKVNCFIKTINDITVSAQSVCMFN